MVGIRVFTPVAPAHIPLLKPLVLGKITAVVQFVTIVLYSVSSHYLQYGNKCINAVIVTYTRHIHKHFLLSYHTENTACILFNANAVKWGVCMNMSGGTPSNEKLSVKRNQGNN